MSNFHPLEVMGRSSETQLQVGENFDKITQREKGSLTPVQTKRVPIINCTH